MVKKRAHGLLPSPEDVLAGRVPARADQLFALVHDVNPTGQESPRERERYALKSRLQGLLLSRFGDEVEIHPDPTNPDLVSLRHRSGLRDACHALVSQLPVEARSLVRRRLDMEAGAAAPGPDEASSRTVRGADPAHPNPPATADDADDPGSLHARGLAALEAYDYEEAQRLLTAAVERGGGAEAARALLELLVDLLADDAGALAVEVRLAPSTASDPVVRGLLALAAAREGETARASKLVRTLSSPLAARVHATLGRTALETGDLARAASHLSSAKSTDPALPDTVALATDLERARQDERRPAEESLLALHAFGDRDAAEKSARALLSRWPDSAAGRRVLREIAETRRREHAVTLSRDGVAALDRGEAAEAVRLFTQALAADPAAAAVSELLSRARQVASSQADEAAVRRAVAALAPPTFPGEALVAFAELPAALRARVRATAPEPRLDLIEEVLSSSPGEKPRAAVEATIALVAAEDALRAEDPVAALRLLETHARALTRVPRGDALATTARARIAAGRAARARVTLARVRASLDASDLDGATTFLHDLRKSDLDANDLAELARVNGRLREAQEARRALRETEARETARRALRLSVSTEPGSADELVDFDSLVSYERARPCLSADGRRLVLANAFGDWLFVRVVDVERGEVVQRISLRTPHAIGDWENVLVEGDRVTVVGEKLGLVVLDLATAEVVRSPSLASILRPSSTVEGTLLLPASDLAWVETLTGPERELVSYLVDTGSGRARAKYPFDTSPSVVLRGASSLLVVEDRRHARLLTLAGLPAAADPPALPIDVEAAAPAPAGSAVLLAGAASSGDFDDEALGGTGKLRVVELLPGSTSTLGRGLDLPGTDGPSEMGLATSRQEGLAFAISLGRDQSRLFAISPALDLAVPPVAVPVETVLFVDSASTHVVAGCWWAERFAAVPLRKDTRWPEWKGPLRERNPFPKGLVLADGFACGTRTRIGNAHSLALYAELNPVRERGLEARVEEVLADAPSGDLYEALMGALERMGTKWELRRKVEAGLVERFPDHPAAILSVLRTLADEGRWDLVLSRARSARRDSGAACPQHVRHLEAIALARGGDLAGALDLLEEIRALGDDRGCAVDGLVSLLRASLSEKPVRSPLGRLVATVKAALVALADGNPRRVVDLLERALLWTSEVFQGHALLAAAWLDLDAATPRDLFRKRRALARLLDLLGQPARFRRDLPALPGSLDAAAIETIAARARKFLDEQVAVSGDPKAH